MTPEEFNQISLVDRLTFVARASAASMFVCELVNEAAEHIAELEGRLARAEQTAVAAEQLRPVWAQGYGTAGFAANATSAALGQLWQMLGVNNQTRAVEVLKTLQVQASLNGSVWRPEERLQLRHYADQVEYSAFRAGYADGWHGRSQGESDWPNAYSAGYWDGFADAGRKA